MKTLRQFLIEYSIENELNYQNERALFNTFEDFDIIAEQDREEHRWYYELYVVTQITIDGVDRFFAWHDCEPKGDSAERSDCDWEAPDIDEITEVYPTEVQTIVYVSKGK